MTTTEKGRFYEKGIEFYIRQNPKILITQMFNGM